ncbi:MAG: cysteine desulfurase [Clostridia bacterium]|nr:cysteine desulfurase [Clostridia bacterium]
MIYFDNSATTRVYKAAADIAVEYMLNLYHNPAAAYSPAVSVERAVSLSRQRIASYMKMDSSELIFTSGGTESNNIALSGALGARRDKCRIITTAVEHPSVYEPFLAYKAKGYDVVIIGVDSTGRIDEDAFIAALDANTGFVSIMHVNNEVGSVNDISRLYRAVKQRAPRAIFHSDGVQAFVKMPSVNCDMYSFSGHKLYAPKGVGGLFIKRGTPFVGGQLGGGQENNLRSGTTNVPSIMALDTSLEAYMKSHSENTASMLSVKTRLYNNLSSIKDAILNGPSIEESVPYILNMSFLGVRGEVLLNSLSEKGIIVSTGSACAARHRGKNRILTAMGIRDDRQDGAIRFSFSPENTVWEADIAAQAIEDSLKMLRRFRRR